MNDSTLARRLDFSGRVAIVTGAGRGIGRAHSLLLAARGAAVIVNDPGVAVSGDPLDESPAEEVAAEITRAGGRAAANSASVADEEGARSIVSDALRTFGRLDIVVNNAGITAPRPFAELPMATVEREMAVHFLGTFRVSQAAWPHFTSAGYGRIVNTTSSTIFGLPDHTSYGAAKAALFGFTKNLATEVGSLDIRVNAIAPSAATRMLTDSGGAGSTPEIIALQKATRPVGLIPPAMAYLAHESCRVNGEIFSVGGGKVSRYFLAETKGYDGGGDLTPEDLAIHLDEVMDTGGAEVWENVLASVRARMAAS